MADAPGLGWPERSAGDVLAEPGGGVGWPVSRETNSENAVMSLAVDGAAVLVTENPLAAAPGVAGVAGGGGAGRARGARTDPGPVGGPSVRGGPRPPSCRL